jgi:uncharacterized integral membrane protein
MKNILTALLVLAVLVLVVGVASRTARVDVSYVAGTWHRVSLLAVAAVVAALLLVVGVLSAVAADLSAGRDRHALEEELQQTYVRLRAAEAPQAQAAIRTASEAESQAKTAPRPAAETASQAQAASPPTAPDGDRPTGAP